MLAYLDRFRDVRVATARLALGSLARVPTTEEVLALIDGPG
jgi:hypothetical protein